MFVCAYECECGLFEPATSNLLCRFLHTTMNKKETRKVSEESHVCVGAIKGDHLIYFRERQRR